MRFSLLTAVGKIPGFIELKFALPQRLAVRRKLKRLYCCFGSEVNCLLGLLQNAGSLRTRNIYLLL
ncbi:hypothetical protein CLOLEP_02440 [[Clostridium] leptum DSM 753]|uniref:Uncharacterized protein n=1 Tax=[Clostridium] leptum DSM 753 TaxID=428125 RepID=A7VV35_9FIRM|nr:hypothetical protein CLOLEP_02440 [[Clostridium] leptum DSM 753]